MRAFLLLIVGACALPTSEPAPAKATDYASIPTRALSDLAAGESVRLDYTYHAAGLAPILAQTVQIDRLEDGWTFEAWAPGVRINAPSHLGKVWIEPSELSEWERLLTEHRASPQPKTAPRTLLEVTWFEGDRRQSIERWSRTSGGDWEPTDWLAPVGDPLTQKLRAAAASLKLKDDATDS